MFLIVGLGNPKKHYINTRHNLGFRVVEMVASRLKSRPPISRYKSLLTETEYAGKTIILAQPLTYMNRSGLAVKEIVSSYQLDLDKILIIYDDLDLPPGTIRLRKQGGGGGHRGVQSIIEFLNTQEFSRLRIGVGKPPQGIEPSDYVLQPWLEDQDLIEPALVKAADAVLSFVTDGIETAMNNYNRDLSSSD